MKKITIFSVIMSIAMMAMAQAPVKKVVVEEFTGAWCGYCPEGAVFLRNLVASQAPNVIAIAVHQGDPLEFTDGTTLMSAYGIGSFPSGQVDRQKVNSYSTIVINRGQWDAGAIAQLATTTKVSVGIKNIVFDTTTRQLDVDVVATFVDTLYGQKRINLEITEDSIPAPVGGPLEQHNYIATYGASIIDGWYHNHVFRATLGTNWGESGIIPDAVVPYIDYTKHYTYTVPAGWNFNQLSLVATVNHYGVAVANRDIINCEEAKLYQPARVGIENTASVSDVQLFPNPTTDFAQIQFNLKNAGTVDMKVYDLLGNAVASPIHNFYNGGIHTINYNVKDDAGNKLSTGVYMVTLTMNGQTITRRLEVR
jgi:thiol-disulfide isomerase/thioredoxin